MQNPAYVNIHWTGGGGGGGGVVEHSMDFISGGGTDYIVPIPFVPGTGATLVALNGATQSILAGDYIELNPTTIRFPAPIPAGQVVKVTWFT